MKKLDRKPARKFSRIVVVTLALITAGAFVWHRIGEKRAEELTAKHAYEDLLRKAQGVQARFEGITAFVQKVAKGDSYAEEIVGRFAAYARPGYPIPGGKVMLIPQKREIAKDKELRFIMSPQDEAGYLSRRIETPFQFLENHQMILYIYDDAKPIDGTLLGTFMLHEIVHWDDFVSGRLKQSSQDGDHARTEIKARDIQFAALDRAFGGELKKTAKAVAADPNLRDPIPELPDIFQPNEDGTKLLMSLFKEQPKNDYDRMWREGILAEVVVYGQGKTFEDRMRLYRFHEQDNEHEEFDIRRY